MSLIKDFNELHFSYKGTALIIGSNIPIFFVSIYLFKYDLISVIQGNPWGSLQFYFVLCLCLTLSIIWFLSNLLLSIHSTQYFELRYRSEREKEMNPFQRIIEQKLATLPRKNVTSERKEDSQKFAFIMTYGYATAYLGICIFVNQQFMQWSFPHFLLGSWGFILFRILYMAIRKETLKEELKKKQPTPRKARPQTQTQELEPKQETNEE